MTDIDVIDVEAHILQPIGHDWLRSTTCGM
jgi:hypothetical protein